MQNQTPDVKNMLVAIALSMGLIFAWQYFYELPRQRDAQQQQAMQERRIQQEQPQQARQPAAETAAKPVAPMSNILRLPKRSPRLPEESSNPAKKRT